MPYCTWIKRPFGTKRAGGGRPPHYFCFFPLVTHLFSRQIARFNCTVGAVLFIFLFLPTASAQQSSCAALPKSTVLPAVSASQNNNKAALAAALNSPDAAAKKQSFEQQLAKLAADPNVQSQRANAQGLLGAAANAPGIQNQRLQMKNQMAAAQSSASFLKNKAAFQTGLKCTEH